MKTNFKRIGKQSISIVLAVMMMLSTMLVGMVTSNAANETGYTYNKDYMYVDLSAISKVASGVNYYWDDAFTNYGGWITDKEDLGNYTYKFDFSAIGSHEYFRGFKIVWAGSPGTNIAVLENNTYNCVKVNSDYTLSWTTYSSTEPTTKYTVNVDKNITNGTVTPSATSLAADETFTVTATPNVGYELDTVTVKDASNNEIKPNTNGSYTMPASNVTVSATFKEKTDAKYSVTYTAPTGEGVVDSSINPTETTLAAGTPVTVTVTVNDGYTASLAVDGATVTTSTSGNTYTFTFSMPAKAITVAPKVTKAGENTGTLIPNLYLIYSDSSSKPSDFTQYLNLYYNSDNQVYAYFDESNFDDSKEYCFMISNSKGESTSWEYAYDHYNNSKTLSDSEQLACGSSDNWLPKAGQSQYVQAVFAKFKVRDAYVGTISSVKINLGYYDGKDIVESSTDSSKATTYEVIPTSGVEGMVRVFAKDGTIRATYQKYADMADTVLTAENTADLTKYAKKDYYDTAYANVGTKLKITTTIGEGYREKYFVKAFSINGYSYGIIDASQADTTDGVYTCEYTIPEDFKGSRIEITPIYYYIDDTDTVTFYVEGFDETVQAKWGNTVAVQAWYTNGEEKDEFNSLTKNALGGYPGQPLVYEGGKYSMQIPKYLNGNKANMVSGITLNNYFWDDIHKQSFSDQSNKSEFNCQTYDYDDFYKLSETADVDNIIFDFRYRTTIDNAPKDNLTNSTYNPDELEPLTDYYGNIVDIFGNILSKDWTAEYDSKCLTVISDGYKENENIGKYATEWSVYDHAGNRIAQINCSSLIDPTKVDPTYQAAYNKLKQQYAGLPVKIAYEMSIFDGYDKGTRADGRWYFSKKAQKISANVKIEYRADDTSPFIEDAFVADSNVGEQTGAKAYFTNADYNGKTTCQGEVDGGNFSVHAQTDANANYYFLGWYLKTSDGYSFITNESDTDIPMTNNATYVARFINTPSGTLTLSHTLLDGSAYGKTFIKADIIDSANNVKASIDETSGNLVIPSKYVTYTSTDSIRLTLRTVPYGNDTVEGFYEGYSSDKPVRYNKDFTGTGEQTYSVTREIKSLFEEIPNADGSTSYKLKKSNIPFYSNITSNPINYQITYVYFTRLDDQQIYVIKDTVSGIELEEMWAANKAANLNKEQLSKAFITKKAPFVSNYREEITWDIGNAIIDRDYTATVFSNTKTVNPKISALTVAGSWTLPTEVEYGTLAMSNGDYLYKTGTDEFPATRKYKDATDATAYEFSFWAIFDNKEAAQKYSDAVADYMSGNPAADMSARLTDLTTLNGYDKLIAKSYSKEYNYISYQDYYIVPVYANRFAQNEIEESQASIRLLEYTRNQWTNENGVKGDGTLNAGGTKTDYLYTDFALSFDKNQELIKNNANIKVGIAFEVVAKYDNVDLTTYKTDSNKVAIGDLLKNAASNGKVGSYKVDNDSADRNVYRYEINNSDISVKNRIEYYLRFKNSETSQQNVMKVYSYIYDTKSGEIYLSDPVYMNMYDIGNLTYITSDLASVDLQSASELG
ncbi:InlB B-repeat-containing protein [Ruminococcus intestinalis]|uniref:InlB B-repeat-containing protein n=1 Tax=Ruminococcus intestinalis TaxID=2763066 RepID=UPI003F822D2F